MSVSQESKYVIVIGGPTASGKTKIAIQLAQYFSCPILSADSRQIYKEMSIGTAKPTDEELSTVDHFFINHRSIHEIYSAGNYEKEARAKLEELFANHDVVIVAGGTGLYLKALTKGLDEFPDIPDKIRIEYNSKLKSEGIASLQDELKSVDPQYARIVDLNNPHRIIRALSISKHTGRAYSSFLKKSKSINSYQCIQISLECPREELYKKISARVDQMMEIGFLDEVKNLYEYKHLPALNTVGYKELFKHLDGEWTMEYAVDKIKQHTRNYAKRQMTWFRNQENYSHLSADNSDAILTFIRTQIDISSVN